jgi:hypothetical protein
MDSFLLLILAALAGAFSLWCPCGYSIAETVTHTVSGWRRLRVRLILLSSVTFSAAVFGFFVGLFGLLFHPSHLSPILLAGLAIAALVFDEAGRRWKAFKPLAVGKQVPREWGIIFSPEAVSVLYGLRLGIAPLTILASWVWWVAIIAGAFYGPWFSALIGVTFAVSRVFTSELATARTTTNTMADRMDIVRKIERPLRVVGALSMVFTAGFMVVTDSSSSDHNQEQVAQR